VSTANSVNKRAENALTFSPRRVAAMMLRYWYLLRSSWPRLIDLIYWPTVQMITWGFIQIYVMQNASFFARAGGTLIGAVLLWDILFRGQLGFSISFLEEMWSRNIGNLMMRLVLRNGLGAENLAWSIMFLFLPLTCVYYPVATLPVWLQPAAWLLPPTYVFEGMRELLIHQTFRADLMVDALGLNAVFFAAGVFGFLKLLQSARRHGSLMQIGE
jgi:ABC-2 type transport system permease protein